MVFSLCGVKLLIRVCLLACSQIVTAQVFIVSVVKDQFTEKEDIFSHLGSLALNQRMGKELIL